MLSCWIGSLQPGIVANQIDEVATNAVSTFQQSQRHSGFLLKKGDACLDVDADLSIGQ